MFTGLLKMLDLTLSQIYKRVFYLWKYVAFDNAWVKDFRPFISFFFLLACFRLAMRQTRVFGVGILNYADRAL